MKIGVLNDLSGPYRDLTGPTAIACVRQAVEEFGDRGRLNVEVVRPTTRTSPMSARTSPGNGSTVTASTSIVDVPTSSVALAVADVVREKNKVFLNTCAATSDLTGKACSPNTVHWTYDTWMLAKSPAARMVKAGGDTWFFITADYAFGHALERDTTAFREGAGRQGARRGASPVPGHHRFLLLPAAGAGVAREGDRPGQCGRRHDQQHQAGAPSSA